MRRASRPASGRYRLAASLLGAALGAVVAPAGLAGCTGAGAPSGQPVIVLAAASLTEAFTTLGHDFQAAHPGARVTLSFGASSTLAEQIRQGAPADVFAAASPTAMSVVTTAGRGSGAPVVFARNQLVIAVPAANPRHIRSLADLARPGLRVALCAEQVPCGAAAATVLRLARVRLTPATLEPDVKAALAKVRLGEVDAALVYRTDVRAAGGEVAGVEFAGSAAAINDYPIVALTGGGNAAGAAAFVEYVRSDRGQAVLVAAGFQPP